jgi:hypothetical protein
MSEQETGVTTPAAEEQVQESVPKERLDAVLEQKKIAEQKAELAQQQAEYLKQQEALRANNQQVDIYKELGLEDGDLPTVQQQKVIDKHNLEQVMGRMQQLETQVGQAAFALQHNDAQEVLNQDFKQLIDSDPSIGNLVSQLPEDMKVQAAYYFGNMQRKIKQATEHKEAKVEVDAAVDNATRPLSASAVSGSTSGLSAESNYANMSRQDLLAHANKVANGY